MGPAKGAARAGVDQKMRAIRGEIENGTSPKTWRDPPEAAHSQGHDNRGCQAMCETPVELIRVGAERNEKIDIRQICQEDEDKKLRKILAPLLSEPDLALPEKQEERPEASKTVCDRRSHGMNFCQGSGAADVAGSVCAREDSTKGVPRSRS